MHVMPLMNTIIKDPIFLFNDLTFAINIDDKLAMKLLNYCCIIYDIKSVTLAA